MKEIDRVAQEVLDLVQKGEYVNASQKVFFKKEQMEAMLNTVLHTPEDCKSAVELISSTVTINANYHVQTSTLKNRQTKIFVTDETTQVAAHRLIMKEGITNLVLLNFASGKHPGGGFLKGSKAQEEDLCRCSGL